MLYIVTELRRLINCNTVQVLVGPEKIFYNVHEPIFGLYSPVMNRMITGRAIGQLCLLLPDVSVDTFVQFSEFAYTGDYSLAWADEEPLEESEHSSDASEIGYEDSIGTENIEKLHFAVG